MEVKECSQEKGKKSGSFPSEEMFELLLKARDGIFEPTIPIRPSASPIDVNLDSRCFYVFMGDKSRSARRRASANEICVKYNNCARSRVWWSEKHNKCLGMVARKMGMRARSPNAPAGIDPKIRHGFEGHWLALVERPHPGPIQDKTLIRTFILDKAPSIVQFWEVSGDDFSDFSSEGVKLEIDRGISIPRIHSPSRTSSYGSTESPYASPNLRLTDTRQDVSLSVSLTQVETKSAGPSSPKSHHQHSPLSEFDQDSPYFSGRDGFHEVDGLLIGNGELFDADSATEPIGEQALSPKDAQNKQRHTLSDLEGGESFVFESAARSGKNPAYQHLDEENMDLVEDSEFYAPKRFCTTFDEGNELSYLVDVLDVDDPGEEDSNRQGNSVPSSVMQNNVSASAGLDSALVAYEIFRTVCETFTPEEFRKWYDLYAQTLFLPNVARGLKYFLDRGDPRLRPDFMYTPSCKFLPDRPYATITYTGSYAKGFLITHIDKNASAVFGITDDMKSNDVYEDFVESKMMLLCSHLYFKQMVEKKELDPKVYWFHTIIKLKNGKRLVVRGYSVNRDNFPGNEEKEIRTLQLQDVSEVYSEILALPPLPC